MIRAATPADARSIAEVAHRAWWREYVDTPPEDSLDESVARWEHHLTLPAQTTLVADVHGVRGFATIGPSRRPDAHDEEGELMSLYVDPPAQGAGVGGALLAAAEDELQRLGFGWAIVDVTDSSDAARAFYEHHGWADAP